MWFTEVLEHLNPYYVDHVMTEVNRVLRRGGFLILTTPNIASIFRRIKLLLGTQPQYKYHVHEYTVAEVRGLLEKHGFRILKAFYSDINDLTFVDAPSEDILKIHGYSNLVKTTLKKPTKLNTLRTIAHPLVKLIPSSRILIAVIATKQREYENLVSKVYRW